MALCFDASGVDPSAQQTSSGESVRYCTASPIRALRSPRSVPRALRPAATQVPKGRKRLFCICGRYSANGGALVKMSGTG